MLEKNSPNFVYHKMGKKKRKRRGKKKKKKTLIGEGSAIVKEASIPSLVGEGRKNERKKESKQKQRIVVG
jgi:hypothetical protein